MPQIVQHGIIGLPTGADWLDGLAQAVNQVRRRSKLTISGEKVQRLDNINMMSYGEIEIKWKDIQVLKLVDLDILLYRFVKAEPPLQKQKRKQKRKQ